jgi:hypothetical protein
MTNIWKNLLIGGFLLAFIVLLGFFNATKPRILVLHSAGADSSWARQVDRGMREALDRNRRPLSVEWHYLGIDSPAARTREHEAQAGARRAIARFNPDMVIAVDDEANSLVAREYVGRARPRILYAALNRPPADFGYAGAANVSGIAERLPLAAVRDAAQDLFPDRVPTIAVIGVDNETGRAEMAQVNAFDWSPLAILVFNWVTSDSSVKKNFSILAGSKASFIADSIFLGNPAPSIAVPAVANGSVNSIIFYFINSY